jgi:diaminohydroxyphosphoribosylaminopyrimidine deaminase/5-amino-6-(5-phosphoribosylamino)uracil reductase
VDQDLIFMKRALELSRLGASLTHPNPMVGAVVVKNNEIIGEGWHHGPGLPHAEVEALNSCREDPSRATLYVTLEPCNHWGKTPPCTDTIIQAQIAAVKIAVADCNCQVAGGGSDKLRAAGIQVEIGLCRDEALEINRSFFYHCQTGRSWVIMKSAASLDGKIATPGGKSRWITGEPARRMVHQLRSQVGAVLIGSGTLIKDDPELTNRLHEPIVRQPLKVLLDSELKVSFENRLVRNDPANLLVFCTEQAPLSKVKQLQDNGVRVNRQSSPGKVNLPVVLDTLGSLGIRSVMIEGGSEIFASFLHADLINEFYLFYAPFFIGGITSKGVIGGNGIDALQNARRLRIKTINSLGEDILIHAFKEELKSCLPV